MEPTKTLAEIVPIIVRLGGSQADAGNWLARLKFSTRMKPTIAGKARQFTRLNAIELALLTAFVQVGGRPSDALKKAGHVIGEMGGKLFREWVAFACGDLQLTTWMSAPDLDQIEKAWGGRFVGVPVSLVPVGAIIRMVDELYGASAGD